MKSLYDRSRRSLSAGILLLSLAGLAARTAGDITYSFNFDPASSPEAGQVANSVAVVAEFYNRHGSFNKHWSVNYHPGIPTAEANYNGYMGYGGTRNERVVFHEAAHTFGMGTGPNYHALVAGGVWRGIHGNQAQFDTYNNYPDGLHGDGHAIWPGGFNYDNEDGYIERFWHLRIMAGIRADMGILSFTREALNEAVLAGETATFHVESPVAQGWQWYKDGVPLADGGDVSGATTATLRIARADATDVGSYHCRVTGGGETLDSRPRRLRVHPVPEVAQWDFEGNTNDSLNGHHGTAPGRTSYTIGKSGRAIDLNGGSTFVELPDAVSRTGDLTLAVWVNWDGGGDWQRVFDFGSGTSQYLCLTPKAAGGGLRLAFKDAINGRNVEYQVNAPTLPTGRWVHLTTVLHENHMTLYVNGEAVGSATGLPSKPTAFLETRNYIGKSQFPDPLFDGRIDDLRLYAKALNGPEVWELWGESSNQAPRFSDETLTFPEASSLAPYDGSSLAPFAADPDADPLTFAKIAGPAWLTIGPDGSLAGRPGTSDGGTNRFLVRATDPSGASCDAFLEIPVVAAEPIPVTTRTSPPATDADDVFHLATHLVEPATIDGTRNAADNDESTYLAHDRSSKGQTFTTGTHPAGYFLQSFTFQHVDWPLPAQGGSAYDLQPGDEWIFQIGTMNGTTKTPLLNYVAAYDGPPLAASGTTGTGRFFTFNLSALGQRLEPETTYYFEVAPSTGDPYFELNSVRESTHTGGTAFRGDVAGAVGTVVLPLDGDFIFHADLEARLPLSPKTVAYWDFEEGPANAAVPYFRTSAGLYEGSIVDRSGQANHLSVWGSDWHRYRTHVPASTTPQTGAPNRFSLQNIGNYPAISATGTSLTDWSPTAWTIEAAIRPDDATNGFQTFVGRDSFGAFAEHPALAALYFSIVPEGGLRILFIDAAGNNWNLTSAANSVQDNKWQAVAATSDGNTLSLHLKNLTDGDTEYTLLGTLDISSSQNSALSTGTGSGGDWEAGVFTVTRGLYNGGHTDRFFGHIDDIRLTDGALAPEAFLYSEPVFSFDAWIDGFPETNDRNAFDDDPDGDGLPNGLEYLLGTNPSVPNEGLRTIETSAAAFAFQHPQSFPAPDDVSARYRWSLDLKTWRFSGETENGTTVTFASAPDTPDTGTTTVTATVTGNPPARLFVDLEVTRLR